MDLKSQYLDERFTTRAVNHPRLPFFHCCEAIHLQSILGSLELQPRQCNEYGEELLYLFYGRPAYKSSESCNCRYTFLMPVCFIINNEAIYTIRRALGFDSGAFRRYANYMHQSMERPEFEISPTKEGINKVVHHFYNGNDSYFNGQAKTEIDYDPMHYQLNSYHSIITSDHKQDIDDRKATIEVQINNPILINQKNIEAIILPSNLALSNIFKDVIGPLNIPIIEIPNYGNVSSQYYMLILDKVRDFLIKKNLIHE